MSETLVSDVFLGILFTKERASRKATTQSRGTVRRESPLAVSFILQTIFFPWWREAKFANYENK